MELLLAKLHKKYPMQSLETKSSRPRPNSAKVRMGITTWKAPKKLEI